MTNIVQLIPTKKNWSSVVWLLGPFHPNMKIVLMVLNLLLFQLLPQLQLVQLQGQPQPQQLHQQQQHLQHQLQHRVLRYKSLKNSDEIE